MVSCTTDAQNYIKQNCANMRNELTTFLQQEDANLSPEMKTSLQQIIGHLTGIEQLSRDLAGIEGRDLSPKDFGFLCRTFLGTAIFQSWIFPSLVENGMEMFGTYVAEGSLPIAGDVLPVNLAEVGSKYGEKFGQTITKTEFLFFVTSLLFVYKASRSLLKPSLQNKAIFSTLISLYIANCITGGQISSLFSDLISGFLADTLNFHMVLIICYLSMSVLGTEETFSDYIHCMYASSLAEKGAVVVSEASSGILGKMEQLTDKQLSSHYPLTSLAIRGAFRVTQNVIACSEGITTYVASILGYNYQLVFSAIEGNLINDVFHDDIDQLNNSRPYQLFNTIVQVPRAPIKGVLHQQAVEQLKNDISNFFDSLDHTLVKEAERQCLVKFSALRVKGPEALNHSNLLLPNRNLPNHLSQPIMEFEQALSNLSAILSEQFNTYAAAPVLADSLIYDAGKYWDDSVGGSLLLNKYSFGKIIGIDLVTKEEQTYLYYVLPIYAKVCMESIFNTLQMRTGIAASWTTEERKEVAQKMFINFIMNAYSILIRARSFEQKDNHVYIRSFLRNTIDSVAQKQINNTKLLLR